jgi:hypothetical protein
MKEQEQVNKSKFLEKLAMIFMWLAVLGSGLLEIGIAVMQEMEHHG